MCKTLDETELNDSVYITKINGDDVLKRRLLDLGFVPGMVTKCVLISPFSDPKAYKINGNVIALRRKDAKWVEVRK